MEVAMKFSVDELNVILKGLESVPWAKANPLIIKIQKNATEQLNQKEKKEEKKEEKK